MCLTATQFNALSEVEQLRLIVEASVIIAERRENGFEYVLYNIDGLYIQETHFLYDDDLFYYSCIEDVDELLPYTEEISIVFL